MYCYFTNKIVDDRIKKYKYIKGKGKKWPYKKSLFIQFSFLNQLNLNV